MKIISNLALFVMLIMLSNMYFSKALLKKSTQQPPQPKRYYCVSIGLVYLQASEDFEDEVVAGKSSDIGKSKKWLFAKNDDGSYFLTNRLNSLVLTTSGGKLALTKFTGDESQKFYLENKRLKSKVTGNCVKNYPGNWNLEQGSCSERYSKIDWFPAPTY